MTSTQLKKSKQGICIMKGCGKHRDGTSRLCSMHKARRLKETNPIAYVYKALKSNAKRRGKEFMLTVQELREFCEQTNYIQDRGKSFQSLTIDRIDNTIGYRIDNIQALTNSANVSKMHEDYSNPPF